MKLTLTDKDSEVLNTWEIVEDYPEDYDFEDLDNDWAEDKIVVRDLKVGPMQVQYQGKEIINEILRMWKVGRR